MSLDVDRHSRPSLARRFDPRRNSLSVMRLTLALTVAVVHANAIGWGEQPKLGDTHLGEVAVDGFFVVSGFLVTRSALRLGSSRRYAWHRALRIMPGFWVCLLVVAFVAAPLIAWLQGRPPGSVLTGEQSSVGYVVRNAALMIRQWDIGGLLGAGGTDEGAMNGALWTLWYEALCYVAVAVLVALVPRRRHTVVVAATVVAMWVVVLLQTLRLAGGPEFLPRFLLAFGLGALGWLAADRIRFTPVYVILAAVTFGAGSALLPDYRVAGSAGLAYLLLWAIVALPVRIEPPADLSYGLYVYHWPVQQVLLAAGATALGLPGFVVLAVAVTALLSLASWHWVEAPALSAKNAAWVSVPLAVPRRIRALLG